MKTKHSMSVPEYKEAQYLNKEDYVCIPKRQGLPLCTMPEDLLYLLGWYIADGNVSSGNYVKFFLQENQYEMAVVLQNILNKYWARDKTFISATHKQWKGRTVPVRAHYWKRPVKAKLFHDNRVYRGHNPKMWVVEIASKDAKDFCIKYGGSPKQKTISDDLYNQRGLLPLIRGLFEGDGHYRCGTRCDGVERNSLELSSIYESLI